MKRMIFILSIALLPFSFANAQFAKNNALFFSAEVGRGNYLVSDINLNYVLKDKYSFQLGFFVGVRKPKTQPEDYAGGIIGSLSFGLSNPKDEFMNFGISAGRIYKLNNEGNIRLNMLFGAGYTIISEPRNWVKIHNSPINLAENYSYDFEKHYAFSIIINPKIEFPFSRFFGLTVSPMLQISKDRVYYGIGVGYMIGLLAIR